MYRNLRIKICCIKSKEEARLAIEHGADALGLVSAMPSGPGVISGAEIRDIAAGLPPSIGSFLLTSRTKASEIISQQQFCGTNTIQLVDIIPETELIALRKSLSGISIVQVIHIQGEEALEQAKKLSGMVNALLLDSGNPEAETRELGGTGRIHNWEISREICKHVNCPVFLAGGLHSENIRKAVDFVQPFGVDLCSGVRTKDSLDPIKLTHFFNSLRDK